MRVACSRHAAVAAASVASDFCGGAVVQIAECVRYAAELAVARGRGWARVQSVHGSSTE